MVPEGENLQDPGQEVQQDAQQPEASVPQDVPVDDNGQPLPQDQMQAGPAPEDDPHPGDDYSGPSKEDLVGDARTLSLGAFDPEFSGEKVPFGTAWQDASGELHGSGLLAAMLFEPSARQRYLSASLGLDVSPLTVLSKRLSRCTLLKVDFTEGDDGKR